MCMNTKNSVMTRSGTRYISLLSFPIILDYGGSIMNFDSCDEPVHMHETGEIVCNMPDRLQNSFYIVPRDVFEYLTDEGNAEFGICRTDVVMLPNPEPNNSVHYVDLIYSKTFLN